MNACSNCGKINAPEAIFCRFCGTKFNYQPQPQVATNPYDHEAPRPYAWKTDEFRTKNEVRHTSQIHQQPVAAPLMYQPQNQFGTSFRCPHCGSTHLPVYERRISTAGWVVFALLLVFTFIFFWVGLLMKEDVAICSVCRTRLN